MVDKFSKGAAIARKFLDGHSVKELATKYKLSEATVAGFLKTHINKNGRVIGRPPFQSKLPHLPGEIWKRIPIPTASLYEASSFGRIRSYSRGNKAKILDGAIRNGYRAIDYLVKGTTRRRSELAHTLVAKAWIGFKADHVIIHLDHDRWNCRPDNIKWVTKQQAQEHARNSPYVDALKKRVEGMTDKKRQNARFGKLTKDEVKKIKTKLHNGRRAIEVAKEYRIAVMTVSRIHTGEIWPNVLPQLTRKKIQQKRVTPEQKADIIKAINAGDRRVDISRTFKLDVATITRIKRSLKRA